MGVGYIDGHGNGSPTITNSKKTFTYKDAVIGGDGNKYSLEITNAKEMGDEAVSAYLTPANAPGFVIARGSNKAKVVVKVLDSSGKAVDWTGVIGLCQMDNKSDTRGHILWMSPLNIKENIYTGENCQQPLLQDKGVRMRYVGKEGLLAKGKTYSDIDLAVKRAFYVKVNIPTSGLTIESTARNSDNSSATILSAYAGYKLYDSTTKLSNYIKEGGWQPM